MSGTSAEACSEQSFAANRFPLDPGIRLLEASAGTGKTFALAHLVLRLVAEQGTPLRRLLVVTYTNAAAAELRPCPGKAMASAGRNGTIPKWWSASEPVCRRKICSLTGLSVWPPSSIGRFWRQGRERHER